MPFLLPKLKSNGYLDDLHVTICNIGSRKISETDDYADQGWNIFAPNLVIYGFDADQDACDVANAEFEARASNWQEKHFPLALGKAEEERTLYVTHHPMCSSLYQPEETYQSRFTQLVEFAGLDYSVAIETTTLDQFCQAEGISEIDFLQIDVQGADLDVLKGSEQILETVLAVQIEVEFSPLYRGQPLFSDIDAYLRQRGFTLFDLWPSHRHHVRSPIFSQRHPGRMLWADAFYVKDLIAHSKEKAVSPDQLFKLACIMDAMDFIDYTIEILSYLTVNSGNHEAYNFAALILESLSEVNQLKEIDLSSLPIFEHLQPFIKA